MASVHKRVTNAGDTTYRVRWRENGVNHSLTFDSQRAANLAAKRINALGRAPDDLLHATPTTTTTVHDAIDAHLAQLTGIQPDTREAYRRMADKHLASLGDMLLSDINRDVLARWVAGLDLSPKSIKNVHGLLSAALATAVRDGHLASNPCVGMRLPRDDQHEQRFLTPDEYRAVRDKLPLWAVPLADFLAGTGCRFGEAAALTIRDIDMDRGTARISKAVKHGRQVGTTKTRRSKRTVWLPRELVVSLASIMGRDPDDPVFVTPAGNRVSQQTFHRAWSVAAVKAGLHPLPRVHDLRHSHVAWLISQGVPLATIQDRLGHESITTTIDRYGHLESDMRVAAADAAGAVWRDPPKQIEN